MDPWLLLPICLLTPLVIAVLISSRKLESPALDRLAPLPDEVTVFEDEGEWALLPYQHGLFNSLAYRAARVRVTNHRIIVSWRPPLWKKDVVAFLVFFDALPTGAWDPLRQTYPAFVAGAVETPQPGTLRIHPRVSDPLLPTYVEIRTSKSGEYLALLERVPRGGT